MSKRLELMVMSGEQSGRRYAVPDGGLRLGRSSSNDLHLLDEELSRNHCLFEPDGPEAIRVIDLASANGTYVNGTALGSAPVTLKAGDRVEAGSTAIMVVGEGSLPPPQPQAAPSHTAPTVLNQGASVDLGLGTAPQQAGAQPAAEPAPVPNSRKIANLLWAGAAAALVTAIVLLLTNQGGFGRRIAHGGKKSSREAAPVAKVPELPASLVYERIDAGPAKISRYYATIDGDSLSLSYDAQTAERADGQKVEERGQLTEWSRKRFDEIFDSADWLGLESSLGPNAQASNALKSWRIKLVRNGRVKEVVVENTTMPVAFKKVCEDLETLINNDLNVQLSLRSPEECLAASHKAEELGDELVGKAEVKEGNLWEGIKSLKRARNELKGLSAYFEDQNRIQEKIEEAEAQLKERYDDLRGRAEQARQIEDWRTALIAYREIRAMIPDPIDPRSAEAEAYLRDIEGRLEAARKGNR